ncbi:MAG: ribosome maturation factor RimM [Coriobacteriales bacterium]|jgi:16S rRNA processing protein RimM
MARRNHAYRNVARVVGKIGKSGEVKVETIDGLPFLLQEGMDVFLTPPPLEGIRHSKIESIREIGDAWAVKFEDSNDSATAFELVGKLCLAPEEELGEIDEFDDPSVLVGMQVRDLQLGNLGKVTDVLTSSEQLTLEVGDDEVGDRYLIPYVDEFIDSIEDDEIVVSIPKSLAELNSQS